MYILILPVLKVLVDKRMFLGTLKKDLEPYVGVPVEYFKIYRLYSGQQEFECSRFNESLSSYRDDEKLTIRLGRALRKGEHRGKVYQLLPNMSEVM
jgi:ubiquitin carboxyl-terminal hydrolase 47